ncbi:MAG: photosystem II complex extrinsic protein PsbU [Okeania sp. SIO3I5]|uniref:photosystem II complex extrinsic protein PsbU n=1 Tax=Okeania sp. SIO3I5 TaxID=2607805 RepID=UPI0013B6C43F|nr:photosystem II complex extrinsic protein PsbU [Okeania sp. SIO3I5]NEQ35610.1 photosystem II complex extrinsic protein PsbU [Okeania sp. SIO3I5]
MKKIGLLLAILGLCLGCLGLQPSQQAYAGNLSLTAWPSASILAVEPRKLNKADKKLAEIGGEKLDLNNSPLRSFRKYRGMFPTIAAMIVDNAPYETVEEVLEIPDLTEPQKKLLEANIDNFTVTPPADVYIEGDYRLNTGSYD